MLLNLEKNSGQESLLQIIAAIMLHWSRLLGKINEHGKWNSFKQLEQTYTRLLNKAEEKKEKEDAYVRLL